MGWIRTTRRDRCPCCGKYGWCEISEDGKQAHCMHQSWGGHPTEYRGGGRIFQLGEEYPGRVEMRQPAKRPKGLEKLPPERVDEINRSFLKLNPLKAEHRASLSQAGVPVEGVGSLEQRRAEELAQILMAQFGEETARLHPLLRPLLSKVGLAQFWTIAGAVGDGMLFPAVSVDGLILGLQLRLDHPQSDEERYRWLSSEGKGGTPLTVFPAKAEVGSHQYSQSASVSCSNWAKSLEVVPYQQGNEALDLIAASTSIGTLTTKYRRETLLITEGYKKAAVINQQWGSPAISLAGVSAYHREELVRTIQYLAPKRIALAFDQDKRQKLAVQQAEARLIQVLREALPELKLYRLEWDGKRGKGVDDAILARANFYLELVKLNASNPV